MKTINNSAAHALTLQELIFLNKNKNYGAYVLRKNYRRNLFYACSSAVFILVSAVYFLLPSNTKVQNDKKGDGFVVILEDIPIKFDTPVSVEKPIVIPKTSTVQYTIPEVVEDTDNEYFASVDDLRNVNPGTETIEGSEDGIDITLIEAVEPAPKETPEPVKETVFLYAEEMPQYPGGDQALISFIARNIRYPELARKAGVEGKVIITYVVNKNGSISDIEVVRGIGAGCDEEAVRVIKLLEKWLPGRQNGNAVSVKMSLPIKFKLS